METVTETALTIVETLTPLQLFAPGTLDPLLERIKAEVRATETDISTECGRKEIASLAYKIARTKTFIDSQRLALVSDEKKRLAAIDAEGKRVREELDALKDEVRKPLTDWEEAEKSRLARHEAAIQRIEAFAVLSSATTTADIEAAMIALSETDLTTFEEFFKRALSTYARVFSRLKDQLLLSRQADADRAELEHLRQEAQAKAQQERDAAIAEAARKKAQAEAEEREAKLSRKAQAERDQIEREKAAAEKRAADAEAARVAAEAKAAQDAVEAERRAKEAAEQAERARVAAQQKAEADKNAAIQAERDRVAAQKRAEAAEAAARARDKAHKASVNNAAADALEANGITREAALQVVTLIAKKLIPNISIAY